MLAEGMYKFRNFILITVLLIISVRTTSANDSCDIYRHEAQSFLSAMPENLQRRQTEAIRRAMAGDNSLLEEIRKSRNQAPELPSVVIRRQVDDNMVLFRDRRYENDTIPLLLYFHGGGWTIGSINSCSRFCSEMALNGAAVLAVDYRLAPEHPFPAGLHDCISAAEIAADSLERWRCNGIIVGGDSSGGNLAIATALSFPANMFDGVVAFYPVTKAYPDNSPSWQKYGHGFGLDSELMEAFNAAYTSDIYNPLVSPAGTPDSDLRKMPPLLIIAAECDILKDQGYEFANHLRRLGNKVCYYMIPNSVHLFITVPGQTASFNRAVSETSRFISGILMR